jgi:RNA polymerase sigma-70 factor (ECF subfamily)
MTTILTARERDLHVVREVLNGNKGAYEKIIREYNKQLFRVGIAYLGTEDGVEDVMQNTYLKAYYHLSQFKADAAFNTWLVRIMINECKQALRKKEKERKFLKAWNSDPVGGYDQGIQRTLIQKEMKEILQQAILKLPLKYRTVFMLREVEDMTVDETATALGIPAPTVRSRLFRAKARLRESLAEELDGATQEVFGFDGERCDRIVHAVLARITGMHPSG